MGELVALREPAEKEAVDPSSGAILWTYKQAAKKLGRSVGTVRRWAKDGYIPSVSMGGARYIPREALEQYIRDNTVGGARRK